MKINLFSALLMAREKIAKLRAIGKAMREAQKRPALGAGKRRQRLLWIACSQRQGVDVALARRAAQKNGTMAEFRKTYAPRDPIYARIT